MITLKDLYTVLSAMVPLYVAMILAYGSVRWWKIFTPVQCSGINRFVAVFAVPLLSFHFISTNNPYEMDGKFILADTISKVAILLALAAWARFSRNGSLDWMITLFALATLPNTLVMGIPLLTAMYGNFYGSLMVQLVVLQCIIWYTLMLFLFEYRAAKHLIAEQFPGVAASIVSFKVDSDVVSLDGREPLQTHADVGDDGKIRVTVRKSTSSHPPSLNMFASPRRSIGLRSMTSSKAMTPRPSNMTGAEIYSVYSSKTSTPREFAINNPDLHSVMSTRVVSPRHSNFTASDIYSGQSSHTPTPRTLNMHEHNCKELSVASKDTNQLNQQLQGNLQSHGHGAKSLNVNSLVHDTGAGQSAACHSNNSSWSGYTGPNFSPRASQISKMIHDQAGSPRFDDDGKELHMFVWSSTASPASETRVYMNGCVDPSKELNETKEDKLSSRKDSQFLVSDVNDIREPLNCPVPMNADEEFSFGAVHPEEAGATQPDGAAPAASSHSPKMPGGIKPTDSPPTVVMMKLILQMVGRKLLQNPNTYSSLLGLIWSLIAFRWNIAMPAIVSKSISILSDAGLGMAMFSLGLFMALQPRIIACGTSLAVFAMAVRFLTGPAVMSATSLAVGLRGVDLHAAIVQAALPQGIVPFVFAREYNLHPDILSTAVIFGMLVALPTTLLYYVLLGL